MNAPYKVHSLFYGKKLMNQTLEQLIKLQEIDQRLLEIRDFMGDLPSAVETQEKEIATMESANVEKQNRIIEVEKEMRHYEREIEDMNTQMVKYKDQLYLVKSNKEYDSLNHEIDHMKTKISDSETQLLNLIEEKDTLKEAVKLNKGKMESITEALSSNRMELKSAMAETQTEQEELETNRSNLFKDIEPIKLNAYEKIRKGREGVGMVSIIGQACGGCYSQLPPQMIIEIKKSTDIITCPSCSIMLFWDGAEE